MRSTTSPLYSAQRLTARHCCGSRSPAPSDSILLQHPSRRHVLSASSFRRLQRPCRSLCTLLLSAKPQRGCFRLPCMPHCTPKHLHQSRRLSASIVSAISVVGSGGVRQSPSACSWPRPSGSDVRCLRGAARKPGGGPRPLQQAPLPPGNCAEKDPAHDLLLVVVIWWPSATLKCTLPARMILCIYRKPVFLAVAAYRLIQTIGCHLHVRTETGDAEFERSDSGEFTETAPAQTDRASQKPAMVRRRFFAACKQPP